MTKKRHSLETLQKMLANAEKRYYEETVKPYNPRGYRQPSLRAWNKAQDRVKTLRREIEERKAEMK